MELEFRPSSNGQIPVGVFDHAPHLSSRRGVWVKSMTLNFTVEIQGKVLLSCPSLFCLDAPLYTLNQQRCLLELGIQPLVLRERGASGQPDVAPLSDTNPPKESSLQQMAKPDHRPSLASLLKTTPDKTKASIKHQ